MHSGIFVFLATVALATCAVTKKKVQATFDDSEDDKGELNLDHHYYEGDIRLTKKQQDWLRKSNDGLYSRALTSEADRLWPNGIIPYVVNPGLRYISKNFIRSAVREWNKRTCLRLVPKTDQQNYIEFVYEGGCSSNLGMVGGRQTVSVGGPGVTCRHGNIVHEIAHCAGFFHEHSRPDRDDYIHVNWMKIKPGFYLNFKKMPQALIDSHNVGYDYDSITHYGKKFFSKDGTPTIITTRALPFNVRIGQRVRLSDKDVEQANKLYGCSVQRNKIEPSKAFDKKEKNKNIASTAKNSNGFSGKKAVKETKTMKIVKKQSDKTPTAYKVKAIKVTKTLKVIPSKSPKAPVGKKKEDKAAKQNDKDKTIHTNEINGELNLGHHYFEGDMILTPHQLAMMKKGKTAKHKDSHASKANAKVIPAKKMKSLQKTTKTYVKPKPKDAEQNDDKTTSFTGEEIDGEQNLGHHYFEGDIMLTPQQSDYIKKTQLKHDLNTGAKLNDPTTDPTKLWSGGVVPYVYGKNLKPQTKASIQSAINEWNSKTCVNIRPKLASDFHYIEFVYKGGCSSFVGMVGNRQYLSVGGPIVKCHHGNIVHEIAHALGFYHEHSRPDRDNHIEVKWDNIIPVFKDNFFKETLQSVNSLGVGYDFKSVMHYGNNFFSRNKEFLKTIETKPPGQPIGQRIGLSDLDIKQANLLYKCKGARKNTVEVPPDIVIATKKDKTKITKSKQVATKNSHKKAAKHFTKKDNKKTEAKNFEVVTKRDEIVNWDDPMIDKDDPGTQMDSQQPNALTPKEKEIIAEMTNNKAADLKGISGEENLGKHYFEGDMMLSNEQKQWFDSATAGANPAKKRALIKNPTYLWKSHIMPYVFHKSVDKLGRKYALQAIKHWEEKTCLRFPKRKKQKNYVMFVFEGGCSSRVGKVGGMQKINIGSVRNHCKRGNIIHEIGHALGFFHEQSRSDRDQYVRVIQKNVVKWYLNNFHRFDGDFVDERGVPYDYNSIMHYGRTFFSYNYLFFPTLVPLYKTIDDKPVFIGQRESLSDMDILQANLLYKCDGKRRLSEKESEYLFKQTQGVFTVNDEQKTGTVVPCKDKYDQASCSKIKKHGYCQTFPDTMRQACGHTCQLCGTVPKNLLTKLRLD